MHAAVENREAAELGVRNKPKNAKPQNTLRRPPRKRALSFVYAYQQKVRAAGAVGKQRRAVQVVVDCQLLFARLQVGQKRRLLPPQAPPLPELLRLAPLVRGVTPAL